MSRVNPMLFRAYIRDRKRATLASPYDPEKDTKLFYVMADGRGWIPVSCYCFASSPERAIERVKKNIEDVKGQLWEEQKERDLARMERILAIKDWRAEEVHESLILEAGQPWADNGGFYN